MMRKSKKVAMRKSKTVLKCENCDPNYGITKLNPRRIQGIKKEKYSKNFVGMYLDLIDDPQDYNEKLEKLICPFCNSKLIDTGFPVDDFHLIGKASDWNRQVLDLMMELHENDPIEYQLKLNQFKLQNEQAEKIEEQERVRRMPHCPHCNSTDIKSISGLSRGASIAMWGIFSNKINKSFECKSCGYTW
ncbi:MAG: hypothetical protein K2M73_02140 [Lachnospiraceae bacterium]|nr:hypothetical protein [Lachnospiraceae bacterium]